MPSVRHLILSTIVGAGLGAGCTASTPPASSARAVTPEGPPMRDPDLSEKPPAGAWLLVVVDGSANRWTITGADGATRFSYAPVTPAESSSGTYSGGNARDGAVDVAMTDGLWRLARAALRDETRHASTRAMGTVVVRVEVDGSVQEAIVQMGGADDLLAALVALP